MVAVDRQVRVGSGVDRGRSPTSPSGPTQTPWPRGGIVAWPPTHLGDLKPLAVGRQLPRSARSDSSVAISRALGMIVVTVHGALGASTSRQLRYILWDLIDQQGNRNVVVDLRDMTLADGAELDLFVDTTHRARAGGGHLRLSGPGPAIAVALARAGLTDAVDLEPTGSPRFDRTGS